MEATHSLHEASRVLAARIDDSSAQAMRTKMQFVRDRRRLDRGGPFCFRRRRVTGPHEARSRASYAFLLWVGRPAVCRQEYSIKASLIAVLPLLAFTLGCGASPTTPAPSTTVDPGPANAWFIHKSFSKVTDGDAMADKPLSKMKSETLSFEAFAARFVPVEGEDADNYAYHQQMTNLLSVMRDNLKHPIVIRLGRQNGQGLVGAISVYIVGTLPSGKVGGLFTVAVET